jgi:SAM-dependent methyltransferase
MTSCCQCEAIESQFGRKTAERELRRFRRRGPIATTRRLVDDLRTAGVRDASLIDIGGGVGAIHHLLLDAGAREALHVDASTEYIEAARGEATRRGHGDRVRFVHGDFVQLASGLPDADIVTLDRVICCYPDMNSLVGHAAEKARRMLGAVYPRDVWWIRFVVRSINVIQRIRRSPFRVFVHSPAAVDAVLRRHGLERTRLERTVVWQVVVYARGPTVVNG